MDSTLKHPSAWIPLVMSCAALALVVGDIALFGAARQADEGTAAHLWQLLMAGQVPFIAYFVIRWLLNISKQAFLVLGLQIMAVVAACTPVFYFNL